MLSIHDQGASHNTKIQDVTATEVLFSDIEAEQIDIQIVSLNRLHLPRGDAMQTMLNQIVSEVRRLGGEEVLSWWKPLNRR